MRAGWWSVGALACAVTCASGARAATHDVGYNVHQSLDTGVPVTAACGGSIVRIDLNWFQAEPKEGAFDWALFDALIDGARAKGLRVLAVPAYTPDWASSADVDGKKHDNDVPLAGKYEAFVAAAVKRYGDRVAYWELWNEPNLGEFFEGTPDQYVSLILKPGANAAKSSCASCKVVGPGIASLASSKYGDWMKAALEANVIDIVSGHVYADFPKYPGDTGATFFTKLEAHREGGFVTDPLSFRESMLAWGASKKPFWLTETGKTAAMSNDAAKAAQAVFYRQVLEAMLSRPWWQTTIFYEAFDEPTMSYDFGVAVRKTSGGFDAKPACSVVTKAIEKQPLFGGHGTDCSDGLDNDGDGTIDLADDDCVDETTVSEGVPVDPDAGPSDDAAIDDAGAANGDSGGSSGGCTQSARAPSLAWVLTLCCAGICSRRRGSRSPSS